MPIMDATFRVQTAYMPKDAESLEIVDPHLTSMQWSRRFTGLKVLLSLMVAGWDGYASAIRHQTAMGDALRTRLAGRWLDKFETKPNYRWCALHGIRLRTINCSGSARGS